MKYEMIFGDDDFGGQSNDLAEVKLWHDCFGPKFVSLEELHCMNAVGGLPHGAVVLAMRRIIKEPKRWTWEDKKAGMLPEVGADVLFGKKGKHDIKIAEFIGTGTIDSVWCLKLRCGSYVFVESEIVNPIETPAEKAQREEDEFVCEIVSGYNKMPSSVPFRAGIRAAYRKLKGGE